MKRRVVGAALGLVFAIFCGFISLLSTGGGHGSTMWLFLFVVPELCGIYFPLMGFLGGDLRSSRSRWIFGIILAVNIIISAVIIGGSLVNDSYTVKAWKSEPLASTFITAIHIVPSVLFTAVLILSVHVSEPSEKVTTPTILS